MAPAPRAAEAWQAEIQQIFEQEIEIHFSAEENALFPAAARFEEIRSLVNELLDEHAALRDFFARALAMEPEVMLFDEPTSALDPQLIQGVARMLRALDDLGKTLVVVSHDMNFARRISDQVIYFEGGHAVEAGTQEEVFGNPQQPETRAFMQSFRDEETPEATANSNGQDPKLGATGTRSSLGQEE